MPTVLCTCADVGIPAIAAATSSVAVSCKNNELVVAKCDIGVMAKPIGAARLDHSGFAALNVAQFPLTPGSNVSPADPTVVRWLPNTPQTFSWTNDLGCQVGIAIGYDAGIELEINPSVSRYRFYIASEYNINGGANTIHASVQARTTRFNSATPTYMREDLFFSANPLGNPGNEGLPAIAVPPGSTFNLSMFGYHTVEPSGPNFTPSTPSPADAVNIMTSTARVWAIIGW